MPGMPPRGAVSEGLSGVVLGVLRGMLPGAVPDGLPGDVIEPGVVPVVLLFVVLPDNRCMVLSAGGVVPAEEPLVIAGVCNLLPEAEELPSGEGAVLEETPEALFCLCLPICWEFTL